MDQIRLTIKQEETFSSISNLFIDHYMPNADGEFVKLYLYLVRTLQSGNVILLADVASTLNCSMKDVCRGIRYWADMGVLNLEYDANGKPVALTLLQLTKPTMEEDLGLDLLSQPKVTADQEPKQLAPAKSKPVPQRAERPAVANVQPTSSQEAITTAVEPSNIETTTTQAARPASPKVYVHHYSNEDLQRIKSGQDKNWTDLIFTWESLMKKSITQRDTEILLYIYDELQFEPKAIEYMVEYCANANYQSNSNFLNTLALYWYDQGIRTTEQAKEFIDQHNRLNLEVQRHLGLDHMITPTEMQSIDTWTRKYGFNSDMIIEACSRAVSHQSPNFSYVAKILKTWKESNIYTLEAAAEEQKQFNLANGFEKMVKTSPQPKPVSHGFSQRDNDATDTDAFYIRELQSIVGQAL